MSRPAIKALSLWQPWASLIGYGKRVETRSWGTAYRGTLAILAAKTKEGWDGLSPELVAHLATLHVPARPPTSAPIPSEHPHGCLVCVCRLVECVQMTPELIAEQPELERVCGWWEPGRWAWFLADFEHVQPPLPARGRQGLFDLIPPDGVKMPRRRGWPAGFPRSQLFAKEPR